jgi:GGDEF domain-containing protein
LISATTNSILGLVELADEQDATRIHSTASLHVLRDVFHDRLNNWVRAKDQWRLLKDNRVCVILRDIGSQGELELAAAKLERVFREPHFYLGKAMPLMVTAGFAEFDNRSKDMTLAIQQAGIALNQAKQSSHLFEVYSPKTGLSENAERNLI